MERRTAFALIFCVASTGALRRRYLPVMAYDPLEMRLLRGLNRMTLTLLALPIALIIALLGWGWLQSYQHIRLIAPRQFHIGTFYSGENTDPTGIMQFAIGSEAADALRANPARFFASIPDGSDWKQTPVPLSKVQLMGDCGTFWCADNAASQTAAQWLSRSGSYYRRWGESDAFLLVVNPREEQIVIGYFYA